MTRKERPERVQVAIAYDDLEYLRFAGAAGGRNAAIANRRQKDEREAMDAYWREKRQDEELHRVMSTNVHIVPFDPEMDVEDSLVLSCVTMPRNIKGGRRGQNT